MRYKVKTSRAAKLALLFTLTPAVVAHPEDSEVQAKVIVTQPGIQRSTMHRRSASVVVWLSATNPDVGAEPPALSPGHFRMAQKNKNFEPHMLVIPLRSTVEFPNLDLFFHNVFSQFNGKKFDLGLYETGSTKAVRFDHEGISYIFCDIHPEMGAVIVTLATPYFAVADGDGVLIMHHVPAGTYTMHVWAEGADAKELDALTRSVHISPSQNDLGQIQIPVKGSTAPHKNKFGEDYRPEKPADY